MTNKEGRERVKKALRNRGWNISYADGGGKWMCPTSDEVSRNALHYILDLEEEVANLERSDEERMAEAEDNIRAEIAAGGTSCRWCEETLIKKVARKILLAVGNVTDEDVRLKDYQWFQDLCRQYGIDGKEL